MSTTPISSQTPIAIHWFRRDFRFDDNVGLYHAVSGEYSVLPIFIFDDNILSELTAKQDRRVDFIHRAINSLKKKLEEKGSSLLVKHGKPLAIWQELVQKYTIKAVFTNRDYEPYAQARDKAVYAFLKDKGIDFTGYKDHVIFEKNEILKKDGTPYSVYSPYARRWRERYEQHPPQIYGDALEENNFVPSPPLAMPTLANLGFEKTDGDFPPPVLQESILPDYKTLRDFPAKPNTSRLSIHFRFGTVSIRKMALMGGALSASWQNELTWRDFYQMIIFHHPRVVTQAFKPKYDHIPWRNDETQFKAWCEGKTGYPLVDAGMRELNETGFMHNRVRMVVASFLTKHLLIDWRWGEAYFAQKLLDFELASNNGGWQWASSSGCDAAPYFRVFNPSSQLAKFDKELVYVKKWIPEYGTPDYPQPIVDHKMARQRAIDTYKQALATWQG